MIRTNIFIKEIEGKGRGVFAKSRIPAEVVVEEAPVIVMSMADREHLDKTLLHDYIFEWGKDKDSCCMALGYVPIYNHNYKSNCEYFMDYDNHTIQVKSVRAIEKDEELTINYNGDWNNPKSIWFDAK